MDINALMAQLAQYMRIAEETADIIDGLKDQLKQRMDADGTDTLIGAEHKATWKTITSQRIDTSALKRELPDIATRYTKQTTTRRFTFA